MTARELPIIFTGPTIPPILTGAKTQTRRIVKLKPWQGIEERHDGSPWPWMHDHDRNDDKWLPCPYGEPGDRLWVREAFMHEPADYCWEASVSIPSRPAVTTYRADFAEGSRGAGWKPSIHMPYALSRITLEVTAVRVELLQDISEGDAMAEGVKHSLHLPGGRFARENFAHLWWTIHGDGSWHENPWVWVVQFVRVKP
jgi:hypothetical protein